MLALFNPMTLGLIIAGLSLVAIYLVAAMLGVRFALAEARLPAAVRLAELDSVVGAKEERLRYLDSEVKKREISLTDRDQAEAEAEHWRAVVESLKAEYAGLSDRRREIEEVHEEYRQTLESLGVKESELRELATRAAAARAEVDSLEARHEAAMRGLDEITADQEQLTSKLEELRSAVSDLEARRSDFEAERTSAAAEVQALRERLSGMRVEEERLARETARLTGERERASEDLAAAQRALEGLAANRAAADAAKGELNELRRRLADLRADHAWIETETHRLEHARKTAEDELTRLRQELAELEMQQAKIESARAELAKLSEQLHRAEERVKERDTDARHLEARIARLRAESGEASTDGETKDILSDLRTVPACFAKVADDQTRTPIWPSEQEVSSELEALHRVRNLLSDSGLEFSPRTINAFHTSLKTGGISPLTVLAGISGTGKSQLPRRYADAMGMHFLKIPVQPRWDSPQDLFGFYNYIEKRYKATELARALVHLDPHNWPDESQDYQDRMLLVLLDEMNLARVEYYFSEFLSRLEGRPGDENARDDSERRPAEISLDIPSAGQPYRVYPAQNVLFVGTMNEDESTLALSDKVLDRANVLQFPRPSELRNEIPEPSDDAVAEGYLPKERWLTKWTKSADRMDSSIKQQATGIIREINELMDALGRPFGHRMSQAMLHYVANYPSVQHQTLNSEPIEYGLADQIEQRILPKLRGLDVSTYGQTLNKLADLAGSRLKDEALGTAIQQAVRDSQGLGIFNWRGFTRSGA